jgi:DNA topoisomerase VI subunit B
LQEAGRALGMYVRKKGRVKDEMKKRSYIEIYIPHISSALIELLELNPNLEPEISENLRVILEKTRGKLQEVGLTAEDNTEYDESLASIGRGSKDDDGEDYDEEE